MILFFLPSFPLAHTQRIGSHQPIPIVCLLRTLPILIETNCRLLAPPFFVDLGFARPTDDFIHHPFASERVRR